MPSIDLDSKIFRSASINVSLPPCFRCVPKNEVLKFIREVLKLFKSPMLLDDDFEIISSMVLLPLHTALDRDMICLGYGDTCKIASLARTKK